MNFPETAKRNFFLIIGIIVTPLLMGGLLFIWSRSYASGLLSIIFPYAGADILIEIRVLGYSFYGPSVIGFGLAAVQMPIYGFILDAAKQRGGDFRSRVLSICSLHAIVCTTVLVRYNAF